MHTHSRCLHFQSPSSRYVISHCKQQIFPLINIHPDYTSWSSQERNQIHMCEPSCAPSSHHVQGTYNLLSGIGNKPHEFIRACHPLQSAHSTWRTSWWAGKGRGNWHHWLKALVDRNGNWNRGFAHGVSFYGLEAFFVCRPAWHRPPSPRLLRTVQPAPERASMSCWCTQTRHLHSKQKSSNFLQKTWIRFPHSHLHLA